MIRGILAATVACVLAALAGAAQAALPASIAELRATLASGTSCETVVSETLARIDEVEQGPLRPRAVLEVNPDALAIARALDAERADGAPARPLHCVTLLVKDNYQTADRLRTTVGSLVMGDFRARRDATMVRKLREAGAVVVGKTNMDEWAHGATGYSSRGGQTRNGRNPLRGPGGSSGGSGSAIALGLALVATGSDTGGSIQIPASLNGVVGLRSTMGLISRAGVAPYASYSDVPGPLTGSVADLAETLGVLTGVDPADPATRASRGRFLTDYTRFLDPDGLAGAQIGVLDSALGTPLRGYSDEVDQAFADALATMRAAGAEVVEGLRVRGPEQRWIAVAKISLRQFRPEIDEWLSTSARGAPVDSLAEIVARSSRGGLARPVRILRPLRFELAGSPPRGPAYREAIAETRKLRSALLDLMRRHDLDALVFQATGCAAPPLPGIVDPTYRCKGARQPLEFGETPGSPAALLSPATELPVLNIPGGPLPGNQLVGLAFLGRAWDEGTLIRLGYAFERAGGSAARTGRGGH